MHAKRLPQQYIPKHTTTYPYTTSTHVNYARHQTAKRTCERHASGNSTRTVHTYDTLTYVYVHNAPRTRARQRQRTTAHTYTHTMQTRLRTTQPTVRQRTLRHTRMHTRMNQGSRITRIRQHPPLHPAYAHEPRFVHNAH